MPNNVPMKNGAPNNPNACYRCGEAGHFAYQCPKKQNPQVPQNQNSNQKFNARPPHTRKVNHVSSDTAQEAPEVMLGTFSVNSTSAIVFLILVLRILSFPKLLLECIVYPCVP
jgi:hypothetical protein